MSDLETKAAVRAPHTFAEVMEPAWLSTALAPLTGGAPITDVAVVEKLRTTATKVRFKARWDGGSANLCLKAFLDMEEVMGPGARRGGGAGVLEAEFYRELARRLAIRTPECVATVIDPAESQGIVIMRDLVAEGARFGSALEPLSPDQAAASLDQIAGLHAGSGLLAQASWVSPRLGDMAGWHAGPAACAALQDLLDGPRGRNLEPATRDAKRLVAAMQALAAEDAGRPASLVHGDCHAGNIYWTAEGPGLIDWQVLQSAGWALDVAYHVCATLPFEVAQAHEWALLDHYLDAARRLGVETPDRDAARAQYRTAAVYGYFLWAMTRRVDPAVTEVFVDRLGRAVERHDSFRALGV